MRAASVLWQVVLCSAALRSQFSPADAQPDTTPGRPGVPPTPAQVARSGGLLSAWAEAAVFAADLLGRIRAGVTGGDDHTSADAFLYELASRTRTAEALDLVYRRHPRLRTFLVCLLLAGVSLLAVAGPITIVACITSGSVPFVRRATAPQHCLACCVLLGMLAMLAFGDLVIMLVCHVAVTDATTRVPAAFAKTAAELRRYVNRTVVELLVELNEDDYGVARSVRTFLYGVISEDAFGRIVSMNCLAALANHSFASKLRLCKNVSIQMLMPGAQLPNEADIIEENLQLQLNRTLESIGELESRFYGFEQRTRLWRSSAVVDHVGVPMAMVLFCVVIAVLGCGIGMGIRSCVNLSGKPPETYRYTGVVFLANAVLVMLFHVLATALLTTTVTTGVLADCYVCLPYRRMGFVYLDRLAQMIWPSSERGLLFALLTPYAVLTKCAGEGASIVELRVVHDRKDPYVTRTTQRAAAPRWLLQSATQRVERNPTAGNCKGVYGALATSMSTFCDKFLKNHLGMTLSLTVGLILSAAILPLTLVVSQYFMVPPDNASAGIGGLTERRESKRRESSRKEPSKNAAYSSNASATSKTVSTRASKVKRLRRRRGGKCLSKPSNRWKLDELYEDEGDSVNPTSTSSSPKESVTGSTANTLANDEISRTSQATGFRKRSFFPWPTAVPWVMVHHPEATAKRCANADFACDVHAPAAGRKVSRLGLVEYLTGRVSPLITAEGEQESSLGNDVPVLAALSLGGEVWYHADSACRLDGRGEAAIYQSELHFPLPREPVRVSWKDDVCGTLGCVHDMPMTYSPTFCAPSRDSDCCLCGGADVPDQ